MIDGLKITVPGMTLIEWCREYADYHTERAKLFKDQAAKLTDADIGIRNILDPDPREKLKRQTKYHEVSAEELLFLIQWIDSHQQYLLSQRDLGLIGKSNNRYGPYGD